MHTVLMDTHASDELGGIREKGGIGLERLLTVGEVAALLQVPPSWVYARTRQRSAERIPGFRLGKYWRFREADVLAWLERQRVGARSNA